MTPHVLFVKQDIDVFGPWRSITWQNETPMSVLNSFLYKATFGRWQAFFAPTGELCLQWTKATTTITKVTSNHFHDSVVCYSNIKPKFAPLKKYHLITMIS